ncbi:MAG: pyridoxal-phosphate dependent enzyme, partial [Acidobacteriota bacterium]|nr:pyridoxal-phosphate dependent enzyme [Acidobacteriota bacterium]
VVPVGGGGLLSGIAIAVKTAAPQTTIIGVEVNASQAFQKSLAAGRITQIEVGDTIADGLTGNLDPESITFDIVKEFVDDMIVVGETAVHNAIRGLAANEKLIVEGAGAAAVAAVLNGAIKASGRNIVPVVSGANIDFERLIEVLPST